MQRAYTCEYIHVRVAISQNVACISIASDTLFPSRGCEWMRCPV